MVVQSSYQRIQIPARTMTEIILDRSREGPDVEAFVDGATGQSLSFSAFADAVEQTAAGLISQGLHPGDVCILHSPNGIEWPVAYHAVLLAGGIVSPTNPMFTAREIAKQASDSGASWMIASPFLLEPALKAAATAGIDRIFAFEGPKPLPGCVRRFSDLAAPVSDVTLPQIDPGDIAVIPYSSGTTGHAKGVMLTHRNLTACAHQLREVIPFKEAGRMLAVIPIGHISGIMAFLQQAPFMGMTVVTLPRFDAEQFFETIEGQRVTHLVAAPPLVLALARNPIVDQFDMSSLETIICAAAPLKENLARACMERVGCEIVQGYGMTECMAVSASPEGSDRPHSAGTPLPNTEFQIVDVQTGASCGPYQQGEVWVRGPQVMRGYLNRPDATAELITADGWLKTGDIAFLDDDRFLYVVDRLKEMIKYKGYQVSPAELEDLLVAHPKIVDAAVIGRPDEEAGELPIAYVVTNAPLGTGEVVAYVAENVAPYKKVRGVEFVDEIPKSPAGKILRRVLIERERGLVAV